MKRDKRLTRKQRRAIFIAEHMKKVKDMLNKIMPHFTLTIYASGVISTTDLVNKIFEFCKLYSGINLYPYQEQFSKRVIRSILENDGAEITALFSRQSGKSEAISVTCGGLMIILPRLANMPMFAGDKRLERFKDGFWIGIFAPSQRQAQITYNRLRTRIQSKNAIAVMSDPDFNLQFDTFNGQTVSLTNGSFATAISASDGSSIEGESFKAIICEEAQDISNYKIRKSIHPMGAAYNATIVKIGTATTFKGDFYEAIQRNKNEYKTGKKARRNHFEYDYKVASKYNEAYRKYVEKEKQRLGEDSDEFRMAYKLEWILSRGMFIDTDLLERLCGEPDWNRIYGDRKNSHVAGIDLAKVSDSTIVTIVEPDWSNPVVVEKNSSENIANIGIGDYKAYETRVKDWLQIEGDDYESQYYQILQFLKNYNVVRIVVDATAQSSFSDRLAANLDIEVIPFVYGTKSKSELYKYLDSEIKTGRAKFPNSVETKKTREYREFIHQLGELQKTYSGQYLVVAHPPERNAHDDYPDSWALAVWGCKEEIGSSAIEVKETNPLYQKQAQQYYQSRNVVTARRRR